MDTRELLNVEEISKKLQEIIKQEVKSLKNTNEKWKNHYNSVIEVLERELTYINELVEDYTESKLTLGCIEAEGYKRCLITMINRFRYDEQFVEED